MLRVHTFITSLIASTASTRRPSDASDAVRSLLDPTGPLPGAPPLNIARVRSIRWDFVISAPSPGALSAAWSKQETRSHAGLEWFYCMSWV